MIVQDDGDSLRHAHDGFVGRLLLAQTLPPLPSRLSQKLKQVSPKRWCWNVTSGCTAAPILALAGRDFVPGDSAVPLLDMAGHNRHAKRPWKLRYSCGMTAAWFGIGALSKCYFPLINVGDRWNEYDYTNTHRSYDAGMGALTPYHNRRGLTTKHIPAGQEIFVDYGGSYFRHREATYDGPVPLMGHYQYADHLLRWYAKLRHQMAALNQTTELLDSATKARNRRGTCAAHSRALRASSIDHVCGRGRSRHWLSRARFGKAYPSAVAAESLFRPSAAMSVRYRD